MSELTFPSGKDEPKHCMQKRSLSTDVKLGLALMGLALFAGGTLNWHWLVAAGLLPIVVCLLFCGAMSGLHLCSGNRGNNQGPGRPTMVPPPGN